MDIHQSIQIIKITKEDRPQEYERAYKAYKEIYNNALARGKGSLEPELISGKPIQLTINNWTPLLSSEFSTSVKADGERISLLIGNKYKINNVEGREIFLVNGEGPVINFWSVYKGPQKLPLVDKIDKCLIDGELLLFGSVNKILNKGQIVSYDLTYNKTTGERPYICFLAFDMMYGPTKPDIQFDKEVHQMRQKKSFPTKIDKDYDEFKAEASKTLEFGSSGAMFGFKGADRWPTSERRKILELMFIASKYSPMRLYLANMPINFTILVSPFIDFNQIIQGGLQNAYNTKEKLLIQSVKKMYDKLLKLGYPLEQSFIENVILNVHKVNGDSLEIIKETIADILVTTGFVDKSSLRKFNKQTNQNVPNDKKELKMIHMTYTLNDPIFNETINVHLSDDNFYMYAKDIFYDNLSKQFNEITGMKLPHIDTDGLIFTPKNKEYLNNTWCFCDNYQYKWKPSHELTVDFIVGPQITDKDTEHYHYKANIGTPKKNSPFIYEGQQYTVVSDFPLTIGSIVETYNKKNEFFSYGNQNDTDFTYKKHRYDKTKSNAYLTIVSVLDAKKISNLLVTISSIINGTIQPDEFKNILMNYSKDNILKLYFKAFNKILSEGTINNLEKILHGSSLDRFEIEAQIKFKSKNEPFLKCILDHYGIRKNEIMVPLLRIYKGTERITCSLLSNTLLVQDITEKKKKKTIKIDVPRFIKNIESVDVIVSTEEKKEYNDTIIFTDDMIYNYQNRYEINGISLFWTLYVIEYGLSRKSFQAAKQNLEDYNKDYHIRVEIEYKPLGLLQNIVNLYLSSDKDKEKLKAYLQNNLGNFNNNDELINLLNENVSRIKHLHPSFCISDFMKILNDLYSIIG